MSPPVIGGEGHAAVAGTPDQVISSPLIATDLPFPQPGALRESLPFYAAITNAAVLTLGRVFLSAFPLVQGDRVSTIRLVSGTQAAVAPTTQVFGFYDLAGNRYVTTADDAATAWPANTAKALAVASVNVTPGNAASNGASAWIVPQTQMYLVAALVAGGTAPSLFSCNVAGAFMTAVAFNGFLPAAAGLTALPNTVTLGAAGGVGATMYASVA